MVVVSLACEPELCASFYFDAGDPRPGVIVLGGSEGGRSRYLARLLAAQGFSTLALAYFGEPSLPGSLSEVPIECVKTAARWLQARPETNGSRIGILGASKGAELALLAASMSPEVFGCVVAYAPSSVVFAGISFRAEGRRRASWSQFGQELAFVPYADGARPLLCAQGLSCVSMYEGGLSDRNSPAAAVIPVEQIDAPIMLLSGGRDKLWPSSKMARMIAARLAEHGRPAPVHLEFPDAGHSFMPWAPTEEMTSYGRLLNGFRLAGSGGLFALGGKPRANRAALRDGWPKVVAFLKEHS